MPRTTPGFLCEVADRLPTKTAIVSIKRSVTFYELYEETLATAECLREFGIQPGDRVGVCMQKSIDQVSVILGILFIIVSTDQMALLWEMLQVLTERFA